MRRRSRVSNFVAGVSALIVVAVACYAVFGGSSPFAGSPFQLKAMFTSETELHIPSPVRIAGVDVGQVVSVHRISRSSDAAVVTMNIDSNGLPIHSDATVNIRSRLFLEGNFYADLHPGTSSAPVLKSGTTLSPANTAGPVQLDRVLAALNTNARTNLQTVLRGLGSALNGEPTAAQDASQDPSVQGLTAGQALNRSLDYSATALKNSAIVNQALLGIQPHDLSHVVSGNERFFRALASKQTQLASFVTTFDATMSTLASRQRQLSQTIAILPSLLRNANSALGPLNASFAPTKEFAAALGPSIKQLDPTIGLGLPWLAQSTALLSNAELGGLLKSLTPAIQHTASQIGSTKTLISEANQFAACFIHNLIPTGDEVIQDPPVGTGLPVYQELFQGAVGLASASGNFDGNGRYIRGQPAGGSDLIQTSPLASLGPVFGNAVIPPLGTRPAFPGSAPPLRRDVPCASNPAPNLNSARTGATP
jgi:phospholipid/cholesterol/gamma-HCH transport system substrate-binding protein